MNDVRRAIVGRVRDYDRRFLRRGKRRHILVDARTPVNYVMVAPIVRAMAPASPEVAEADAIMLNAYDADWGPIQFEGNLHDRATYRYYWEQLQRAKVMGIDLQDRTKELFFAQSG